MVMVTVSVSLSLAPPESSVTVTSNEKRDGLAVAQELQRSVGDRVVPAVGVDREAAGQRRDLAPPVSVPPVHTASVL